MQRQVVLLRGINLGPRHRIAMPELRRRLTDAGFEDVRTYLQSGNVVLSSRAAPQALARRCERQIADAFGLEIRAIARTRDELAEVIARDPLSGVATNPKRYQVTFLEHEADPETVRNLDGLVVAPERFIALGHEFYTWHPEGVGRSRLWARIADRRLGVLATSRNWTSVTALLAMADE